MKSRRHWSEIREKRLKDLEARRGYGDARLAYELGEKVRGLR
jgi:hypothetical protein